MTKRKPSKFNYLFLIIVTLILAVVFYSGIVFKDDLTGRVIVGSVWLFLSIIWITQYVNRFVNIPDKKKMKPGRIFLLSVLSVAAVFQFFGLFRYYNRMQDDVFGHLLYIASIIFLLAGIVVIIVQITKRA